MGRRVLRIVLLLVSGIVTVASFAVAPILIQDQITYGTFASASTPPRVDYCGRRYYPGETSHVQSLAQVEALLAENGLHGLTQVGTAPSGMPVVTNVLPSGVRVQDHTSVCTMALWVQSGPNAYVAYGLSGGP